MTNEVAIKAIQDFMGWFKKESCIYQALEMAIQALNSLEEVYAKGYNDGFTQAEINFENDKALSQEPCDDAVSREKVLMIASSSTLSVDESVAMIKKLPSVNPQYTGNEFFNFDAPMVKKSMERDTISRDAVREILSKYHLGESRIAEELNELPSVQRTSNADKKHVENTLDDAISREELLKAIDTWDKFGVDDTNSLFRLDNLSLPHYVPYIHYDDVIKCIKGMPSVTQKSKTGHWVADVDRWGDVITTVNGYRCDKCNAFNSNKDNFCPNCGARMESGDKE